MGIYWKINVNVHVCAHFHEDILKEYQNNFKFGMYMYIGVRFLDDLFFLQMQLSKRGTFFSLIQSNEVVSPLLSSIIA